MTNESSYSISKLAEKADTTPRTIRYYLEQGLLPAPETKGKYAYYSDAHLRRLRLIQRLKNAYLPLASIRTQMESLTDEEVNALLARFSPVHDETNQKLSDVSVGLTESVPSGDRLAYLTQVLEVTGQARSESAEAQEKPVRRALLISPVFQPGEPSPETSEQKSSPPHSDDEPTDRETWERVRLAAGVELHVKRPATETERRILEQRIAAAKALFAADV
jgi:DNA-binding transcriptional MerR regulator